MIAQYRILLLLILLAVPGLPMTSSAQAADDTETSPAADIDEDEAAATEESADTGRIRGRILPAPFVITEPAIGKGLGLGFIYFHGQEKRERPRIQSASAVGNTARRGKPPPTATAAGGFYTDNETAGVAIAHSRSLADDKYRIVGLGAAMEINAKYYEGSAGLDFRLDADALYTRGQWRVKDSNILLGISAAWLDGGIGFDLPIGRLPGNGAIDDFTDVGVAVSAIHDSRDESMMPGSGHLYDLTIWRHDDALGSDFNYTKSNLKLLWFNELHQKFHLGFRIDVSTIEGDPPFFAIPYVSLRGIPALRYQGDTAGAVEVEARYDISPRWASVAFLGAGFANWDDSAVEETEDIYSKGLGLRYQLFTEQNVWVGLDVARAKEESNWYIQIGHPW